jgi:putative membrane protein
VGREAGRANVNAKSPTGAISSNEASTACAPGGGWSWNFWPILPLALIGGFIILVVVAWRFGVTGWGGAAAPFSWPIFPLGFFLLIVALFLAFRFARWGRGWGGSPYWGRGPSAEEILRERYARGEISEQEYRERLEVLAGTG